MEFDLDAEINVNFAYRIPEILKGEFAILPRVDHDHEAASPPDHFIKP